MKLSVLFVDDDDFIINGIRRMMYSVQKKWDLQFAGSGAEALDIIKKKPVDIIFSDLRMPGIDGNQLLTIIKEKYPQIVRITLSGYANDNIALINTKIVHQSLAKPSTSDEVKSTIERIFNLRQVLNNDKLLKIINGLNELPSLPQIYLKLEEEINSPETSIDRIANIISNDPIITAKILQITSSAFFGLPTEITNIKQALNYLGTKVIQTLVLSIKLFKNIDPNNPSAKLYQNISKHSNEVAFLAKHLSKLKKSNKKIVEETFLSGLLHDIGKLVILGGVKSISISEDQQLKEYEKNTLKTTHADIGAYLIGIWGLQNSIVEAVKYHNQKECQNFETNNVGQFVFTANNIINSGDINLEEINSENIDSIYNKYGKSYLEGNINEIQNFIG